MKAETLLFHFRKLFNTFKVFGNLHDQSKLLEKYIFLPNLEIDKFAPRGFALCLFEEIFSEMNLHEKLDVFPYPNHYFAPSRKKYNPNASYSTFFTGMYWEVFTCKNFHRIFFFKSRSTSWSFNELILQSLIEFQSKNSF